MVALRNDQNRGNKDNSFHHAFEKSSYKISYEEPKRTEIKTSRIVLQINCAEGNESGVCGNVTQVEAYRVDRYVQKGCCLLFVCESVRWVVRR